jgi:hypothetical protein
MRTGAWQSLDVLFELGSRTGPECALGQNEKEIVTPRVMASLRTNRDPSQQPPGRLEVRGEFRPNSGLVRGRDFLMKNMYGFQENSEDFDRFYAIANRRFTDLDVRADVVVERCRTLRADRATIRALTRYLVGSPTRPWQSPTDHRDSVQNERKLSAGLTLADAELIGLSYRVVVSARTRNQGIVEGKSRTREPELMTVEKLMNLLSVRS